MMISINWKKLTVFFSSALFLFLYNEYLVYYVVLVQCSWPLLDSDKADFTVPAGYPDPLKVMILADTHLLGSREGHWFDKLRRYVHFNFTGTLLYKVTCRLPKLTECFIKLCGGTLPTSANVLRRH